MTLAELKKEHPELFAEIETGIKADLRAKFDTEKTAMEAKLAQEKTDLEAKHAQEKADLEKDLGTKLTERDDRILKLEKADTIRTENERENEADRIWTEKLTASEVDPKLHEKVRQHVSYSKFVKDDVFDEEAFTAAVEAEIKDWDGRLPKHSSVIGGGGFGGQEVTDDKLVAEDKADEKLADDIFKSSGGKKEEVK